MGIDNEVDRSFGRKRNLQENQKGISLRNPTPKAFPKSHSLSGDGGRTYQQARREEEGRTARVLSRARTRARACCRGGGGDRPRQQPFYK